MPGPVVYVAVAISAVAAVIVFKEFVYDPHFRPKLSAWREGLASRQRRRARPHLRSLSSTPSDSEDEGQQPLQRGMLGKSNDLGRSEYTASSQIELRELIASEVESLRSSGEEADKASIRFRHKRNSHDRRVDNPRHTFGSNPTSQTLISLDGSTQTGDPSGRILEPNHVQSKVPIPSPLLSPPTNSHEQTLIQTVLQDEVSKLDGTLISPNSRRSFDPITTHIQTPKLSERSSTPGSVDLLTHTPKGATLLRSPGSPSHRTTSSDVLSVDHYLTPRDQTLSPRSFNGTLSPALSNLSTEFLSSPFYSPPASPSVDVVRYRGESTETPNNDSVQQSNTPGAPPGVVENPLPVIGAISADSEVFSLLSQVSSDTDSDEGDYDSASMLGSEMSSWASDFAYGEGTTQHT